MTDRPLIKLQTVNLDCSDAHEMAAFYGKLLGWQPTFTEPDWVLIRNPDDGTGCPSRPTRTTRRRCGPRSGSSG